MEVAQELRESHNMGSAVGTRNPAVQDFLDFEDSDSDDIGVIIQKHTDAPLPEKVTKDALPHTAVVDDATPEKVIQLSP